MSTTFRKTAAVTWTKDPTSVSLRNAKAVAFASDVGGNLRNLQGYAFQSPLPGGNLRTIRGYAFQSVKPALPLNVTGDLALYALINTNNIALSPWSASNSTLGVPSALGTPLASGQNTQVSLTAKQSSGYSGAMTFQYARRNLADAFPTPVAITVPGSATTIYAQLAMINTKYAMNLTQADVVDGPIAAGAASVVLTAKSTSWLFLPGTTAIAGSPPTLASVLTEPNLPGFTNVAGVGPGYPYAQSVLQMHFEGSGAALAADSFGHPMTTVGNVGVNSTFTSKFGTGCSGSTGVGIYYTTVDRGDLRLGADFTIEFWMYCSNVTTATGTLLAKGASLTQASMQLVNANLVINSDQTPGLINVAHGVAANTFTHIALVKAAGVWTLYVGGVAKATITKTDTFGVNASPLVIANSFNGAAPPPTFMDELRISNGIARYTAAFTPLTYAFGDVSTTTFDGLPTGNAQLLMHFDGADTSTVFKEENGRPVTNTGGQLTTALAQFGPSSLAPLPVSSNVVTLPSDHSLQLSDNWTMEAWVNNLSAGQTGVVFSKDNGASPFAHLTYAAGFWQLFLDGAAVAMSVAASTVLNTWIHIAVVKRRGTVAIYQNGVSLGSLAAASTFGNNNSPFQIGNWGGLANPFQGYIDEVRVSKVARYFGNFTPPTAPFALGAADRMTLTQAFQNNGIFWVAPTSATTILAQLATWNTMSGVPLSATDLADGPIAANASSVTLTAAATSTSLVPGSQITITAKNTALLMHFDGTSGAQTWTDERGHAMTTSGGTVATLQLSNVQAKFGGTSFLSTGAGAIITPSAPELMLGVTTDFTIEFFFNMIGVVAGQVMYEKGNSGARVQYNAGKLYVYSDQSANTDGGQLLTVAASFIKTAQWQHIAIVKFNGTWTAYVDGVAQVSVSAPTQTFGNNTNNVIIGNYFNGANPQNGYMDELRVSNVARYTAGFTPPTAPFVLD
jgi:hypothetical protein